MKTGAVIVAAGMSTRMCQFKQLMTIGNIPMAERVIMNFQHAGIRDIAVVTGYQGEKLEQSLRHLHARCLKNENYRTTEMFDSAKIGLKYIKDLCEQTFFCPADVPVFTEDTVKNLLQYNDMLVQPVYCGKIGHPVKINCSLIPDILRYKGDRGLKGALDSLGVKPLKIAVDDRGTVMDADTKEDYERLVSVYEEQCLKKDGGKS